MLISNFRNSLGYEFNYELNIFQPKISVDEESGRTSAPEDIVSLDGRIKYFIEDIYKAFKDYWHAPPLKTGIASLGYHPLDSLIDHSLIDINFSTEPKAPDDEDIIGVTIISSYSFVNEAVETAFCDLLWTWGPISTERSYSKKQLPNKDIKFNSHVVALESWLALVDLVMLNHIGKDIAIPFNQCAQDLDIYFSGGSVEYNPKSLMSHVANFILGSGLSTCSYCNNPFLKTRKDNKYCSNSCRVMFHQNKKRKKLR